MVIGQSHEPQPPTFESLASYLASKPTYEKLGLFHRAQIEPLEIGGFLLVLLEPGG
jgi:hypothetical protein